MATRSRIGLLLDNDYVLSVYHHWDGYPSWLGVFLQQNYTTKDQIAELLDGGDISSIESDEDWERNKLDEKIVLYYNDRGEKTEPKLDLNVEDYVENENGMCEEYAYLFVNNQWECYDLDTKLEVEIKDRGLVNV
jgi:hypothetical protein